MNDVAVKVTLAEKGKKSISIGQVKEVIRCTMEELINNYQEPEILRMMERYEK